MDLSPYARQQKQRDACKNTPDVTGVIIGRALTDGQGEGRIEPHRGEGDRQPAEPSEKGRAKAPGTGALVDQVGTIRRARPK